MNGKSVNKRQRMHRKAYTGQCRGADGHYKFTKEHSERILGPRCCSKRCTKGLKSRHCSEVTDNDWNEIFDSFWTKLDWGEKKVYGHF